MREFPIKTNDWAIAKYSYHPQSKVWRGAVMNCRPGRNATDAWENACEVSKLSKREIMAAGWSAQRIIITGRQ